jgi:DNA-binding NarL/FixJ family response regulator
MKTRIMILDDHEAILTGYVDYLEKNGKNIKVVFQSTSITKTFAFLERNNIDILILDICFPPKFSIENTISYIKHVKKQQKNCKILLITGYAPKSSIKKALANGADYVHIKGSLESLLEDVKKMMSKEKHSANEIEDWDYCALPELNTIEKQLLKHANLTNLEIAKALNKGLSTIDRYISDLCVKLTLKNKQELYAFYKVHEYYFE